MTIAQLKYAKRIIEKMYTVDSSEKGFAMRCAEQTIDEAIAHQSITNEAVKEAIEWINNTGHANQDISGNWTAPMRTHINQDIQNTILLALQEYQPKESCQWCKDAFGLTVRARFHGDFGVKTMPNQNGKHCPNCGRKLDE